MSKNVSPKEVRKARSYLRSKGLGSGHVPPRRFARAAKELNSSFSEVLRFIARQYAGGQNRQADYRELLQKAVEHER